MVMDYQKVYFVGFVLTWAALYLGTAYWMLFGDLLEEQPYCFRCHVGGSFCLSLIWPVTLVTIVAVTFIMIYTYYEERGTK
jgi:uncharacterized membrane protein